MRYSLFLMLSLMMLGCSQSTSNIIIKSTPAGARVTEAVKGELGNTPLQIQFTKEDCINDDSCVASFYFSKPGFKDVRVERYVDGKEILVHAYLLKNKTKLIVSGYPSFAKLDIQYLNTEENWKKLSLIEDGGLTPSLEDEEPWGGKDYCFVRIIARSMGYIEQEKTIRIKKGESRVVEYSLKEYIVNGEIVSKPAGADVYERTLGYLGRTPFKIKIPYDQLMRISAQRKQNLDDPVYLYLKLSKEGYETVEKIKDIGEISDSDTPIQFSIPVNLVPKRH